MDSKSKVLTELLEQAQFYLSNSKKLNYAATYAINRLTKSMRDIMEPKDLMTVYMTITDVHSQALHVINNIVEKFPVEHTIQELQMLELFRSMSEHERHELIEILTDDKGQDNDGHKSE